MPDATILSITEASQTLSDLVDQVNESHEPIMIASAQGNAVLVSEQIWNALQEPSISTPFQGCGILLKWASRLP
ncbi:type II toxin-antitoxin system Phd/YefM family antitoxin [Acaryochloris sp. CCMEE 5410]|uniref:type II toxin-antitoxin system Phd/YefM family antitoxin n=1 Tax=Acaryochloris sp. CCMEE 5410 TaxID=310037 RepID=UPI002934B8C5|nr:type II toxin-antitoxin system Phd/YefM family antitoxin [Acaryochloris sp. CCMEE 5410]